MQDVRAGVPRGAAGRASLTRGRSSAVAAGYWRDDYIKAFAGETLLGETRAARRPPLIHRGYYCRVQTVYALAAAFAARYGAAAQVLSLGAGFDTLFFRLNVRPGRAGGPCPPHPPGAALTAGGGWV